MAGGFGAGGFGSMPFGSGSGASVQSADQYTRNSVLVTMSDGASIQNRGDVRDALNERGWSSEGYNEAGVIEPIAVTVEKYSANQVVVYFDAEFAGPGVVYRMIASTDIVQADVPVSSRSALFRTFGAPRAANALTSRSFDIANPQTGGDGPGSDLVVLGTLALTAEGDYRNDAGIENLRKRVIRRWTTQRGRFAHLPEYGLELPEKHLVRPGKLRVLQAQAQSQAQAEVGVISCTVSVAVPTPGVLLLSGRIVSSLGSFGVEVTQALPGV